MVLWQSYTFNNFWIEIYTTAAIPASLVWMLCITYSGLQITVLEPHHIPLCLIQSAIQCNMVHNLNCITNFLNCIKNRDDTVFLNSSWEYQNNDRVNVHYNPTTLVDKKISLPVKIQSDSYSSDIAASKHGNQVALSPTSVQENGFGSKTTFVIRKYNIGF